MFCELLSVKLIILPIHRNQERALKPFSADPKYMVIAYKNVSGLRMPIAASVTVHAATKGTKYTIAKAVQINVTKVSLAAGKTFQLKASEVKDEPAKKISAHRKIKYESINPEVAKVNKDGKITAKKKGKATLYVYSQNGLYKKVKVTVS